MKKYLLGICAIAAAIFASSFTVKGHIHPSSNRKPAIEIWYFVGTTTTQVLSDGNYASSPSPSHPCNNKQVYPCKIQFDASSYMTPTTNTPLQNYLNAEGTAGQVEQDAVTTRN